ncbi:hypothetical protein [Shimia sp.]|uniref:hypothetical protein n=1 Tax=Shimia sp. TaxID=1954381 RepID=UPI003BACC4F8
MRSHGNVTGYRPRRRRHRPKGRRRHHGPHPYGLLDFIVAYMMGIIGLGAALAISPMLAFFAYFAIGIILSRYIGKRVRWREMTASIRNVAAVKLHTIYTWPVSMPVFIFQLFVVKFL